MEISLTIKAHIKVASSDNAKSLADSLKEEDSFKLFPRLGLGLAIISMGCWIGTYAMGVYIL